jgi:hypothetical protein
MGELAKKKATYEDLYGIPENMTGEIIEGGVNRNSATIKETRAFSNDTW